MTEPANLYASKKGISRQLPLPSQGGVRAGLGYQFFQKNPHPPHLMRGEVENLLKERLCLL